MGRKSKLSRTLKRLDSPNTIFNRAGDIGLSDEAKRKLALRHGPSHGQNSGDPTNIDHTILDGDIHTDSVADTVTRGSVIVGNATPKWDEVTIGAANKFWVSDGTDPAWQIPLASQIEVTEVGTATYDDVQDLINIYMSRGLINGGEVTDNGNGTVNIASGQCWLRVSDTALSALPFVDFGAEVNLALTDQQVNYIYVDYNDGVTILVAATTSFAVIAVDTRTIIASAFRDGNTIHFVHLDHLYSDIASKVQLHLFERFGTSRVSGLIIGASARYITLTSGVIYGGLQRTTSPSFDTDPGGAADTFTGWYTADSGTTWVKSLVQTQIDNLQYNDITTGLENLTPNRYGVHWVFTDFDGQDLHVQFGQGNYTENQAVAAQPPAVTPPLLSGYGVFVGKIVIKKSAATMDAETPFDISFTGTLPTDHNALSNVLADQHHTESHKDLHDPEDGADPLDTAAPANIDGVQAAATGTSHSFPRADHAHRIQHSIADNALVTFDGTHNSGEHARLTASGLEGLTDAELLAALSGDSGAAFDWNDQILQKIKGMTLTTATELTIDGAGAITATQMVHTVDTASDDASDNLDTINGGTTVSLIIIRPAHTDRSIVVRDGQGNIELQGGSNITLDDITDHMLLFWDTTNSKWVDFGGGGGGGVAAHAILDGSVHTDSVADAVTQGSIIVGNATPKWDELAIGAANTVLATDGTDPSWRQVDTNDIANDAITAAKIDPTAAWGVTGSELLVFIPYVGATFFYRCQTHDDTVFTCKINGGPVGAAVVYDTVTGNEDSIEPYTAEANETHLVLHNLTRGDSALIESVDTGTNTITLTDTHPASWVTNDDLTAESQTATSGRTAKYYDIDCSDIIPASAKFLLLDVGVTDSGGSNQECRLHPFEAIGGAWSTKSQLQRTQVASVFNYRTSIVVCNSQKFCLYSKASGAGTMTTILRCLGWWEDAAV